jgi:hypothetical protein
MMRTVCILNCWALKKFTVILATVCCILVTTVVKYNSFCLLLHFVGNHSKASELEFLPIYMLLFVTF